MPDLWLPGVTRLPPTGQSPIRLGLQGADLRLFTWHTFEAPYTYSPDGIAAMRYLHSQRSTSHFVLHPTTGALVQALPMDVGARTLRANGPSQHTNAFGMVHAQVEVIAYANRPFTLDLTRAGRESLQRLMDFLRSWGIPDQWGFDYPPPAYPGRGVPRGRPARSGHVYHAGWWANDHGDPGAIAAPWTIAPPSGQPPATPGRDGDVFFEGADGPDVHEWQRSLTALGYPVVGVGPFGPLTTAATRAFQTDAGITVDGRVGPVTRTTMEDTMSILADLPQRILDAPFPLSALSRANPDLPDAATVGEVLDLIARRSVGSWRYAHTALTRATQARDVATTLADEVAGIRSVMELLAEAAGQDREHVRALIDEEVAKIRVSVERIEADDDEPTDEEG